MRENERGLILTVQITRQLKHSNALGTVHEYHDSGQQVSVRQLAIGEDRAAGNAEMMLASLALKLAARLDAICLGAAAARAIGNAIGFSPTHRAEIGVMDSEPNVRNKLSRGKFTAVFLLQCLEAIGSTSLRLD